LENHSRKIRRDVKKHEERPQGRVSELMQLEDYGRIMSLEGRDIYFHRNSVVNTEFDALELGDVVTFFEEQGEEGPQATAVFFQARSSH
jgi:cold shock CspA family protein